MSQLLADENIPLPAVTALRAAGHDVHTIQEQLPGASDEDVLAATRAQARILAETVELIVTLLNRSDIAFDGQFTVVSRERIRQRPLPPP